MIAITVAHHCNQLLCPRLLEHIAQFFGLVAKVDGNDDRADLAESVKDRHPFEAVHHESGDRLASLDPLGEEGSGQSVAPLVESLPTQTLAFIDYSVTGGPGRHRSGRGRGERTKPPPPP